MPLATSDPPQLISFPVERPFLRGRRRDSHVGPGSLPYFLCGDENRVIGYLATLDAPVFDLGNPILLVGPIGCGKTVLATHLAARDVARSVHANPPTVLYQTSVDFARQYAEAVASDDLAHLQQQVSSAEVWILDDLHLIADKPAAQEELALRVEERYQRSLPTIVTCRRLPSEIRGMRASLVSRVLPGLTVPIALPVGSSRRQLLAELADAHGVELSAELLSVLDTGLECPLPCRALEAAIKQLALYCRMHDSEPTIQAVQSSIAVIGSVQDVSPGSIAAAVARQFRLRVTDLKSSSRKQHLVRARSLAMLLTRRMTSLSMHQIGDFFGGRDHTTVLHAIRKTETLLENDAELHRIADEVREKLKDQ
jgi:chromosomal replication initiator protein